MKRLVLFLESKSPSTRIFLTALPTAAVFYFGAFLSNWITQLWQGSDWRWKLGVHGLLFIFFGTLLVTFARLFKATQADIANARQNELNRAEAQRDLDRDALNAAHAHCDRVISGRIGQVTEKYESPASFLERFCASTSAIQAYVRAAYLTFEDKFGNGSDPLQRINFEVTFMTMSYKDNHITICACANRENRAPRSMVLREKDRDIYKHTETAKIYAAARPEPIIVGNTSQAKGYAELYAGELARLCSSIIYPVLSDKNELLGTIVVHCDRPNFFSAERNKYWFELLEVFAKRIALEKRKLDVLATIQPRELKLTLPIPKPI
ncbi:MAG TPA: GAF domain-containing protein [Clostridia bacterium]|nr:GAF domain-containing protein [Clostridia bacterium]